jgi:hypothetical protein
VIDFDATVQAACQGAFGEQITFLPASGARLPCTGIFDEHSTDTKFENGDEIVQQIPVLGLQASQFGANPPAVNDQFLIRGRRWRVSAATPDSLGHIHIRLMLADDAQANLPATPPIPPLQSL